MYTPANKTQSSFLDFNQPLGLHMNPDNRWIQMADQIPWDVFEKKYAHAFKNERRDGNISKPLRMALGAMIIQARYGFSDRELVEMLTESPYFQYFIGLPGYQQEPPFEASLMVSFRKRISADTLMEANEYLLRNAEGSDQDDDKSNPPKSGGNGSASPDAGHQDEERENAGTMIIDATCAPSNIRYPQDFSLLNEAREKCEHMIDLFCRAYGFKKPRTGRRVARKNYLALAKCRKRPAKKIRKTIKKQLAFVRRDLGYLSTYMSDGYAAPFQKKETENYLTILKLYEQQEYMYRKSTHSIQGRIVSLTQPFLRPIVRGKTKNPTEFGAKFDMSTDEHGFCRIEKFSFDPYNETGCLIESAERYRKRTGKYPERILADQIYRSRINRAFCREHHIRLSGPKLGRPSETAALTDRKTEYQDNTDRIEVERGFSLAKRCYGIGLIHCRLAETTLSTIALSIFTMNLFRITKRVLFTLLWFYQLFNVRYKNKIIATA